MTWSTTDFISGDGVTAENGGSSEVKKSCFQRNGLKVLLLLLCGMVFLVTTLGGMWYLHTLTEEDIREEIRRAVQEAKKSGHPEVGNGPVVEEKGESRRSGAETQSTKSNPHPAALRRRSDDLKSPSGVLLASRKPWLNLRLPPSVVPHTYVINLDVDMDNDRYKGNVTIDVSIATATNVILLHNIGPHIDNVTIKDKETGEMTKVRKQFSYAPNEFYVLELDTFLKTNSSHTITLFFHAALRTNDLTGFYVSHYDAGDGEKKKVASTFFSPISARTAFPCFDEPVFKATFTLILKHSSSYKAHSNMLPYSTCETETSASTEFRTTLKMSTYYLAWVIGDYKMVQHEKKGEKWDIRGLTYGKDVEDIQYSLNTGYNLLKFYEQYFGIPYPLAKLDLLALPSFGPGGMENWGMITFRGERILNNKRTTQENRQKSFNLVAHELTHQWFGNLVTMEFWTDAWLKEGFANNIGTIGGHHVDAGMGSKEHVLSDWMLPTMELDSYSTSHPVSTQIKTSNDIRSIFDLITYNKGSCLVGLLHSFIGDEHFKQGLHRYLTTYAYANARQDDLWAAMTQVSGKNVKAVMDTWTLQLGYPVISVSRINSSFVRVHQERYSLDAAGVTPPPSPFGYIWKVPLIFKSHTDSSSIMHLLEGKSGIFRVPEKFTLLNPDHAMFYRVNYDQTMLSTLKSLLKNDRDALTAQDRTGLLADQFSFIQTRMSDVGTTLDMLSYLKHETDFYPWKIALERISFLETLIEEEEEALKFDRYVQDLIADTVANISWNKVRTINNGSLQALLLNKACHSPTSQVYLKAKTYFEDWIMNKNIELRPTLVRTMRDCVIAVGPEFYWNYLYLRYQRSSGNYHDSLLWSLTSTTNVELVKRLLTYSIDNEKIDSQYTVYVIIGLSKNSNAARDLCWSFIKENWELIFKRYGRDIFMLSDMLSAVLPRFSSERDLKDVETFFAGKNLGTATNAYYSSLKKIRSNISWKKNHFQDFRKWLKKLDVGSN